MHMADCETCRRRGGLLGFFLSYPPYLLQVSGYPSSECDQTAFSLMYRVSIILVHSEALVQVYKGNATDPPLGCIRCAKFEYRKEFE